MAVLPMGPGCCDLTVHWLQPSRAVITAATSSAAHRTIQFRGLGLDWRAKLTLLLPAPRPQHNIGQADAEEVEPDERHRKQHHGGNVRGRSDGRRSDEDQQDGVTRVAE